MDWEDLFGLEPARQENFEDGRSERCYYALIDFEFAATSRCEDGQDNLGLDKEEAEQRTKLAAASKAESAICISISCHRSLLLRSGPEEVASFMLGAQSSVSKERLDALYLLDKHIRQNDWDTVSAMLESDVIPTLCSLLDGAGATECEEIYAIATVTGSLTSKNTPPAPKEMILDLATALAAVMGRLNNPLLQDSTETVEELLGTFKGLANLSKDYSLFLVDDVRADELVFQLLGSESCSPALALKGLKLLSKLLERCTPKHWIDHVPCLVASIRFSPECKTDAFWILNCICRDHDGAIRPHIDILAGPLSAYFELDLARADLTAVQGITPAVRLVFPWIAAALEAGAPRSTIDPILLPVLALIVHPVAYVRREVAWEVRQILEDLNSPSEFIVFFAAILSALSANQSTDLWIEGWSCLAQCLIFCPKSASNSLMLSPSFLGLFKKALVHIKTSYMTAGAFLNAAVELGMDLGRIAYGPFSEPDCTDNPLLDFLYAHLGAEVEAARLMLFHTHPRLRTKFNFDSDLPS